MPRLSIDNHAIEVNAGTTILEAARAAGIAIPTLCHAPGLPHQTSCLVCMVKVAGSPRLMPACGTPAAEGMVVDASGSEVVEARRTAVELLLGDHEGECLAPCENACPAGLPIPRLLHQVASGRLDEAVATLKSRLALPSVLTRLCGAACEKGCRRGVVARAAGAGGKPADHAVAILAVERAVAEHERRKPWMPTPLPASGKRFCVVGSGPAGLAACWALAQAGHACVLWEQEAMAGGGLRHAAAAASFPPELLASELAQLETLGIAIRTGTRLATSAELDRLAAEYDGVILALGEQLAAQAAVLGLSLPSASGHDHGSGRERVLIARCDAKRQAVRSAAEGRSVALQASRQAMAGAGAGAGVSASGRPWSMRRLPDRPWPLDAARPRAGSDAALGDELAAAEAQRCLQCGCAKADGCRLRVVAGVVGAEAKRYPGTAMAGEVEASHPLISLDVHKCIACGLCVAWCERERLALGLGFSGRGPRLSLGMPLGRRLADLPDEHARACAALCPSGALSLK